MFHMKFEVGPVEVNNDVPAAVQLAIPLTLCNKNLNIETSRNWSYFQILILPKARCAKNFFNISKKHYPRDNIISTEN